jgi:hypothetical protein
MEYGNQLMIIMNSPHVVADRSTGPIRPSGAKTRPNA